MLKRRETLCRFLDDGSLPLDNNRCEQAIRPVVMGRSNWLFAGSLAAASRAAQIMSLLETAKMNGLSVQRITDDPVKNPDVGPPPEAVKSAIPEVVQPQR